MMPLRFRQLANLVHEVEPRFKIRKQKTLRDVMVFDNLLIRQLPGKWN